MADYSGEGWPAYKVGGKPVRPREEPEVPKVNPIETKMIDSYQAKSDAFNSISSIGNQWITTTTPATVGGFQFPKQPDVVKKDVCGACDGSGRAPKETLTISVFHEKGDTKKATRIFLGPYEITNIVGVLTNNGEINPTSIDVRLDQAEVRFYDESEMDPAFIDADGEDAGDFWGPMAKEEIKQAAVEKARSDYAKRMARFRGESQ